MTEIRNVKSTKGEMLVLDVATEQATTYLYRGYRILGLHIPQTYRIPYIIYSIILNAFTTIYIPIAFTLQYVSLNFSELDVGNLLTSMQIGINCYGGSSKLIIMAFMLPRLYDAHKLLEHMDQRCQDEDEIAELHKIVRFGRNCSKFFIICYYSYSTSTLIGAVLAGHVPYSMYLPFFDWQQSKLELIFVTIIQYILINIAGLHQICDDTYPVIYIGILRAHLQILLIRVQKLQSLGNADVEDNLKKLKIVIKDHKHLIELYNIIAPVISLTTFVQFFFTAAILSTTLINVTIYTTELSGRVGCLFYIIAAIVQIFPLCYFATGLTVDFSKVTNEIFHTNWFDQDKDYKQTLVFFMQRSQLKMELKAENFFPITLDSFVNLAKFSFSLYTLIKNMGAEDEDLQKIY